MINKVCSDRSETIIALYPRIRINELILLAQNVINDTSLFINKYARYNANLPKPESRNHYFSYSWSDPGEMDIGGCTIIYSVKPSPLGLIIQYIESCEGC